MATLPLGAAGCAGYGSPDVVKVAIRSAYVHPRPEACYDRETQRFAEQTTFLHGRKARAACALYTRRPWRSARKVDISGVRVRGDEAYAHVTVVGGHFDGEHQTVRLLLRNGEWMLDAITAVRIDRVRYESWYRSLITRWRPPQLNRECFFHGFSRMSNATLEQMISSGDNKPWVALRSRCRTATR
jgi:hypothetical protein